MTDVIIELAIGRVRISASADQITKIEWSNLASKHVDEAVIQHASTQLLAYFKQAHNDWSLPLAAVGTDFQQRVWHYLQTIPIGETRYYSDVAKALNSSARAVGNACRANPFVIVVPCHRVVSKAGLGGYDGKTTGNNIKIKQWLLQHERV